MGSDLDTVLLNLRSAGIEAITGQRMVEDIPIAYILFNTTYYQSRIIRWKNRDLTLNNAIKSDAYELIGLDSMQYERAHYGSEYNHYLDLSYAISELARGLTSLREEMTEKYKDMAISEFARAVMPKTRVSLHCHEFGVFYAIARLKKLGVPVRTVATLHATAPWSDCWLQNACEDSCK